MPNRFEWSEILIVGIVGGVTGACLMLAIWLGASIDNLLNFFGGAVGSGLAVTATLWLEKRRRERALEQMMTSLVVVASIAMRFEAVPDNMIRPAIVTFEQGVEAFEASRLGVSIQNPLHQYGLQVAIYWIKRAIEEMQATKKSLEIGTIKELEFQRAVRKSAANSIGAIEDFLGVKGLPQIPLAAFRYHKAQIELERITKEAGLG